MYTCPPMDIQKTKPNVTTMKKEKTIVLSTKIKLTLSCDAPKDRSPHFAWAIAYPKKYHDDKMTVTTGGLLPDKIIMDNDDEDVLGMLVDFMCVLCGVKPYRNDGKMKYEGDAKKITEAVYDLYPVTE